MIGLNSGLLGSRRSANFNSATGLWTANEQILSRRINQWPISWSPLTLTPGLWLDANDSATITLTSGAVSQWSDKSGNARHATQTTASKRPLVTSNAQNSCSAITFDATDDAMVTSYTINRDYTIAIVAMQTGAGSSRLLNSSTANRLIAIRRASEPVFLGGNVVDAAYGSDNTYLMGVLTVSTSATSTYHYNGTNIANASPSSADWGTLTFGASGVFSEVARGSIGEVVVVPSALSTTDRQKLEGYFAYKWGLSSGLPAGHPYKDGPP